VPTRDPTAPPPLPDLGAPGPLVGTTFTLVLAREAPLTLDELAAVEAAAEATPLRGVDVAGIDGFGAVRVAVTFGFEAVDPGLERLQALPTLLLDLARAVPRAKVRARDPSGLLGWTGARFTLADPTGRPLPGLPEGYAVPASARLRPRPPTPPVAPPGEPELADVLEAVSRGIAPPPRIAVPAARLRALAEGRVLPAAALALMGASAADDPGALLVARALLSAPSWGRTRPPPRRARPPARWSPAPSPRSVASCSLDRGSACPPPPTSRTTTWSWTTTTSCSTTTCWSKTPRRSRARSTLRWRRCGITRRSPPRRPLPTGPTTPGASSTA
jgi:hypothetical protein